MADPITARGSESKFKPHPEGQYVGQCVDTIDLGDKLETFAGKSPKLAPKCAIVFRTGEKNDQTGDYIDIAREFTVSMGDLANLRKFLEQWRGKPYEASQIEAGVPLHKLAGNHALLTIAHKTSGNNRVYANVTACVGIPKQMADTVKKYDDYERADYWETKKKAYADEAAKFRAEMGAAPDEDTPPMDDTDDGMPF